MDKNPNLERSKRTGKIYTPYNKYFWNIYIPAKMEIENEKLSELGILLNKMLDNPNEWFVCHQGYGKSRKLILRHPRGDIGLDVTQKFSFDVEGRAVLTLEDREYLWTKVAPIVQKQTGIPNLEFDNRRTEQTRKSNRKKFFKDVMASIMEITGGQAKNQ